MDNDTRPRPVQPIAKGAAKRAGDKIRPEKRLAADKLRNKVRAAKNA